MGESGDGMKNICTDLRDSMRKATTKQAARYVEKIGVNRLADAILVKWPALEESFRRELEDAQQIAREKGLLT